MSLIRAEKESKGSEDKKDDEDVQRLFQVLIGGGAAPKQKTYGRRRGPDDLIPPKP